MTNLFPTEIELFEELSQSVSGVFFSSVAKEFFDALVDEFHQQQH